MNKPLIIAVVVTYNRKELLYECLQALHRQDAGMYTLEILVVDNASTDGTGDMLKTCFSDVHVLSMTKNIGGAGGFCAGMKEAVAMGCDRVWIMDDDTIPSDSALSALMCEDKRLFGKRYGFLSSTVNWSDGSLCKMNIQTMDRKNRSQVKSATFVSLLIPKWTVLEAGLPIADYFIWGDDKEYTMRLSDRWPCYYVRDSIVIHKTKNNEGSNISVDSIERVDRYFFAYRNDLYTARRRGLGNVLVYLAGFGLNALRVMLYGTPGRSKRLSIMFKGFVAGIHFHPEIEFITRGESA